MKHWLKNYGVLRFITTPERKRISKQVVKFYDYGKKNIPKDSECRIKLILEEYEKLNGMVRDSKIKKIRDKSFLSLTSKALWCKYPEIIPIYDNRVRRAIRNIPNPTGKPLTIRRTSSNQSHSSQPEIDCINYENFIRIYFSLYDKVCQKISGHPLTTNCPYAIRVFDKILWLHGE